MIREKFIDRLRKKYQFGGARNSMYDQTQLYQQGGLSNKVIQNYQNVGISQDILNQLNTTPSDTVLAIKGHPDLGESSQYLREEAMFSGIPMEEQDTRAYRTDQGLYDRYSKFKKSFK